MKNKINISILVVIVSLFWMNQALMGAHILTIKNETKKFEIKATNFDYRCDWKCHLSRCSNKEENSPEKLQVIKPGSIISVEMCHLAVRLNLEFKNIDTKDALNNFLGQPGQYISLDKTNQYEVRMDDGEWAYFFAVNVVHHIFGDIEVTVKAISRYKTISGGLSSGPRSIILISKEDL